MAWDIRVVNERLYVNGQEFADVIDEDSQVYTVSSRLSKPSLAKRAFAAGRTVEGWEGSDPVRFEVLGEVS
jgi:hypothetical protein